VTGSGSGLNAEAFHRVKNDQTGEERRQLRVVGAGEFLGFGVQEQVLEVAAKNA
jgi:hypothetical protein